MEKNKLYLHEKGNKDCICTMCDARRSEIIKRDKTLEVMDRINDKVKCGALGLYLRDEKGKNIFAKKIHSLKSRDSMFRVLEEVRDLISELLESSEEWKEYSASQYRQLVRILDTSR
jgi:hypothetical protein